MGVLAYWHNYIHY